MYEFCLFLLLVTLKSLECWRDRSAMDNHLLLGAGDTPTLTTSSSMMSGQRAVSFDPEVTI